MRRSPRPPVSGAWPGCSAPTAPSAAGCSARPPTNGTPSGSGGRSAPSTTTRSPRTRPPGSTGPTRRWSCWGRRARRRLHLQPGPGRAARRRRRRLDLERQRLGQRRPGLLVGIPGHRGRGRLPGRHRRGPLHLQAGPAGPNGDPPAHLVPRPRPGLGDGELRRPGDPDHPDRDRPAPDAGHPGTPAALDRAGQLDRAQAGHHLDRPDLRPGADVRHDARPRAGADRVRAGGPGHGVDQRPGRPHPQDPDRLGLRLAGPRTRSDPHSAGVRQRGPGDHQRASAGRVLRPGDPVVAARSRRDRAGRGGPGQRQRRRPGRPVRCRVPARPGHRQPTCGNTAWAPTSHCPPVGGRAGSSSPWIAAAR